MLLSKALRMQQDLEDKKNKIIIEGLENKIKDYEASLEKKDFLLQAMEGSLAEIQAENAKLREELVQKSESFEQQQQQSLLSQARWGRLEMKPHMKTSELNPQRKQGKQRQRRTENDETGEHIKEIKPTRTSKV
jgi:4-alpha-glucanotransferase